MSEPFVTDRGWLLIPGTHFFFSSVTKNAVPGVSEIAGTTCDIPGDAPVRDTKRNGDFVLFGEL